MNSLLSPDSAFGDGVNWAKVADTVKALVLSPLIGFALAALLVCSSRRKSSSNPALFKAPEGNAAAANLDSWSPGPDLHGRQLCSRLKRRSKGHGTGSSLHSRRHRANGILRST